MFQILQFLIEKNYKGGSLKKKDLTSISSRLFQETFDFLARHVDPNWRARHPGLCALLYFCKILEL